MGDTITITVTEDDDRVAREAYAKRSNLSRTCIIFQALKRQDYPVYIVGTNVVEMNNRTSFDMDDAGYLLASEWDFSVPHAGLPVAPFTFTLPATVILTKREKQDA